MLLLIYTYNIFDSTLRLKYKLRNGLLCQNLKLMVGNAQNVIMSGV